MTCGVKCLSPVGLAEPFPVSASDEPLANDL